MKKTKIGIIIGSDSDLKVMKKTAKTFDDFGIKYEFNIISAHRTPQRALEYASSAAQRGLKVLIAAAGMAAHLAGVIAAHTALPVIGVPLSNKNLDGTDALLATVQMPPGVPVATVAIDGAKNAALLALQIIATSNEEIYQKLLDFKKEQQLNVTNKSNQLNILGYENYEKNMKK